MTTILSASCVSKGLSMKTLRLSAKNIFKRHKDFKNKNTPHKTGVSSLGWDALLSQFQQHNSI